MCFATDKLLFNQYLTIKFCLIMNLLNLISDQYCIAYKHLSNKATEVHFQISFGAEIIYRRYAKKNLLENILNVKPELQEVGRKKVTFHYIRQNVNWYYLESGERASTDEQTLLNNVKFRFVDKFLPKGETIKMGYKLIGEQKLFPRNTFEVIVP